MAKAKINSQITKTAPRPAVSKAETAASRTGVAAKQPSQAREARPSNGKRSEKDANQLIAERAFLLFERRGYAHGHHEQDWIEAEKQIHRELKNS